MKFVIQKIKWRKAMVVNYNKHWELRREWRRKWRRKWPPYLAVKTGWVV